MVKQEFKIIWSDLAISSLKDIYDFYVHKSVKGANNVISDILDSPKTIVYSEQYQVDEQYPDYRRIIVRDYKVLYVEKNNIITVTDIVCTLKLSALKGINN